MRLGVTSDKHTFIPGECRLSDGSLRGQNKQRQGGVHEPRVPAASAPGAGEGLRDTPRPYDPPQEAADTGGAASSDAPPEEETGQADPDGPRMGRPPRTTQETGTQANEGPSWSPVGSRKSVEGIAFRVPRCTLSDSSPDS